MLVRVDFLCLFLLQPYARTVPLGCSRWHTLSVPAIACHIFCHALSQRQAREVDTESANILQLSTEYQKVQIQAEDVSKHVQQKKETLLKTTRSVLQCKAGPQSAICGATCKQ